MTRRFLFLVCLVGSMLIIGGATTQAAADGTDQPFNGRISGTSLVTLGTPNAGSSVGTAIASQLGRSTYDFDWTGVLTGNITHITGTIIFVAANGDTISGTVTGTGPLFDPVVGSTGPFDFTITISAGTGRFASASGTIHATGTTAVTAIGATTFTTADVGKLSGRISSDHVTT